MKCSIILYDFSFERNCISADSPVDTETQSSNKLPVLQTATALATTFAICKIASYLTKLGLKGGILPAVTAIVVVLATIFPAQFGYLAPTGEAIALILMQVYPVQSYFLCKPMLAECLLFLMNSCGICYIGHCSLRCNLLLRS